MADEVTVPASGALRVGCRKCPHAPLVHLLRRPHRSSTGPGSGIARREATAFGILRLVAVLEETLHDLSRWGRATLALIPALLALYLGTLIGATLVSANRDALAIAGLLGYLVIVVGIPVLIALRAVRGGGRWSGAVTRSRDHVAPRTARLRSSWNSCALDGVNRR